MRASGRSTIRLWASLRRAVTDVPTRVRLVRTWTVPAVLVIVASIHLYRAYAFDQSSWGAGCGFGMFATVDYHGSRYYRCWVKTDRGQLLAQFKPNCSRLELAGRVVPSEENLRNLCQHLARSQWYRLEVDPSESSASGLPAVFASTRIDWQPDSHLKQQVGYADSAPIRIRGISLELWGIGINAQEKQLVTFLKRRVELDLSE